MPRRLLAHRSALPHEYIPVHCSSGHSTAPSSCTQIAAGWKPYIAHKLYLHKYMNARAEITLAFYWSRRFVLPILNLVKGPWPNLLLLVTKTRGSSAWHDPKHDNSQYFGKISRVSLWDELHRKGTTKLLLLRHIRKPAGTPQEFHQSHEKGESRLPVR